MIRAPRKAAIRATIRIRESICNDMDMELIEAPSRVIKLTKSPFKYSLKDRKAISEELFTNNKFSDEYYTRGKTWERFITSTNIKGKTVYEPFYGDGTSALTKHCKVVFTPGDFWDTITTAPEHLILTNPPFSFKWLVIQTLLELRRSFAMILPWQSFYNSGLKKIKYLIQQYGGKAYCFNLTGSECDFYHPADKNMKRIGCKILFWIF
jgi:hypothetical protein